MIEKLQFAYYIAAILLIAVVIIKFLKNRLWSWRWSIKNLRERRSRHDQMSDPEYTPESESESWQTKSHVFLIDCLEDIEEQINSKLVLFPAADRYFFECKGKVYLVLIEQIFIPVRGKLVYE